MCLREILREFTIKDFNGTAEHSSRLTSFTPASKQANSLTNLHNLQHISFKFGSSHTADVVGPFIENSLHGRESPDNSLLSRGKTETNRTALKNSR